MATNYTGNATPTLNNAPANSWATDAEKRSHIGNTYLVTGSGGTSGNVYAFEEFPSAVVKEVPASGLPAEIVTITDGGENLPMTSAEVSLSPIQSLNGYDSPWPAGGGKNKLPSLLSSQTTASGLTLTPNTDGSITISGTATNTSAVLLSRISYAEGDFPLPAGTYTLSRGSYAADTYIYIQAVPWSGSALFSRNAKGTVTYANDISIRYTDIGINVASGETINVTIYPQLESGSTATAYAPYSNICPISGHTGATLYVSPTTSSADATTYSVTFSDQGTVYGGTFDFVTGDGEITMLSYDLAGRTWTMETIGDNTVFSCNAISTKALNYNFLCNKYKNAGTYRSNLQNGECGCFNNSSGRNRISICDNAYSTVADFVASIADIQVVYELATPQTFTLSPQQIETLLGENNVWSDAGEISKLVYRSNQYVMAYDWFETWTMPKITRNNGNVIVLPYPKEYTPDIYDVDASTTGRNAAGTMIRDRVAVKHKFNYKFPPLSQADATELLNAVRDPSFTLTTASPETGAKTNYRVYVGDRSLPVYWMPNHSQNSWLYESLTMNLIEM